VFIKLFYFFHIEHSHAASAVIVYRYILQSTRPGSGIRLTLKNAIVGGGGGMGGTEFEMPFQRKLLHKIVIVYPE